MKYVILFAFFSVLALADNTCISYECGDNFKNKDSCMRFNLSDNSRKVYLRDCDKDMICDPNKVNNSEATCVKNYTKPNRYPGEYCRNHIECLSHNCTKEECIPSNKDGKCSHDWECNKGLYCLNNQCTEIHKENATCNASEQCDANLVCSLKKCTKIGSKAENDSATVPGACSSFYIENEKCKQAPSLKSSNDIECEYTNGRKEKPLCGLTTEGKKYCKAAPGDVNMQDVSCLYEFLVYFLCPKY